MKPDVCIRTYFSTFKDLDNPPSGNLTRAVNGLIRGEIHTMKQLCDLSVHDLSKVRNLGEKTLALIIHIREQYVNSH